MEKNVKISILCEMYGNLLTKKQYDFIDNYYNKDLSLSEIAENEQITRQAVRDIIKKGENKLFEYEEKLGFMKKEKIQQEKLTKVIKEITNIQTKYTEEEIQKMLEKIKKELAYLV